MPLAVIFTMTASGELDRTSDWCNEQSDGLGYEWLQGIQTAMMSLAVNPDRCGIAHKSDHFPCELRELLFGIGQRKTHRVLFHISEREVVIVGIRHVSRRDFSPENL